VTCRSGYNFCFNGRFRRRESAHLASWRARRADSHPPKRPFKQPCSSNHQVLATLTFHLRSLRREVCAGDPTTPFLRAVEVSNNRSGLGAVVALLLKLNVNVDGGDGDWRSTAKRNAGRMADLVRGLSPTSQKQFARALSLHDATPINRSSRAWFVCFREQGF
jgi:hypothetical protein